MVLKYKYQISGLNVTENNFYKTKKAENNIFTKNKEKKI